jgi:hypothetical protein
MKNEKCLKTMRPRGYADLHFAGLRFASVSKKMSALCALQRALSVCLVSFACQKCIDL